MGWLLYRKQTDTHIPAGWIQNLNVAVFIEFSHGVKHKEFSHAVCVCVCVCVYAQCLGERVSLKIPLKKKPFPNSASGGNLT